MTNEFLSDDQKRKYQIKDMWIYKGLYEEASVENYT
jgi:hypothetical protein